MSSLGVGLDLYGQESRIGVGIGPIGSPLAKSLGVDEVDLGLYPKSSGLPPLAPNAEKQERAAGEVAAEIMPPVARGKSQYVY